MGLSESERRVVEEIERGRDELVALASDLIAFDTTAREPDDPPRQERELQEYLGGRLRSGRSRGRAVRARPRPSSSGKPLVPPGMGFEGRPQLVARFPGTGGGQSLLLNGHIDAVS